MPRRIILKKKDIWTQRQKNYARHFEMHIFAMQHDERTRNTMIEAMTEIKPEMTALGEIDDRYRALRVRLQFNLDVQRFSTDNFTGMDMLNPWVWSKEGWKNYVDTFNALDEPTGDYQMKYIEKEDRVVYVPLTSETEARSSEQVRGNNGTSGVVVPSLYEK